MSKYDFLDSSSKVTIIGSGNKIVKDFPQGVFKLMYHPEEGAWFNKEPLIDMNIKEVYGSHDKYAELFYRGYMNRNNSTGVLLTGLKGTGKTLISRILSKRFLEEGKPVIIIDRELPVPVIVDTVGRIEGEYLLVIDEFEKNYEEAEQNKLLSFLDGLHNSKRMVIIIANDVSKLTKFIVDRPNRMLFRKHFKGLTHEELTDYLNSRIGTSHPELREELEKYIDITPNVSFDIVTNIVDTCMMFGFTFQEVLEVLNVPGRDSIVVDFTLEFYGVPKYVGEMVVGEGKPFLNHDSFLYGLDGCYLRHGLINSGRKELILKREYSIPLSDVFFGVLDYLNEGDVRKFLDELKFDLAPLFKLDVENMIWENREIKLESKGCELIIKRMDGKSDSQKQQFSTGLSFEEVMEATSNLNLSTTICNEEE